ncbi:ATP-dependent helicase/nuclease subunit B [Clostridiales Family XIII bacterium PM5-7]
MLNIFYGRETLDKEKFIYEKIGEKQGRTLVMVPDQYTLEAEKQAFRFLHAQGLMDVEMVSMSRLGYKILAELGGNTRTLIDKYGRHMLLAEIAAKQEKALKVFSGTTKKEAFLELTNNFISELKQYSVTPEDLEALMEQMTEGSLLKRKLTDLLLIYREYEEKISGKYTDSEDYIDLYMEKINESTLIKGSQVWVYGFDSFAPKAMEVLGKLIQTASDVNVVLTYDVNCRDEDLFQLPKMVIHNLIQKAEEYGVPHLMQAVDEAYLISDKAEGIRWLEAELFAVGRAEGENTSGITLLEAANMYNEAESAASFILELIRDKGLRLRDIVVICNDQQVRGSVISRVFEEYGLGVFDDTKRSILNSPIAIFVVSLLEIIVENYRTTDVFKVLKTGFSGIPDEDIELLENYAIKYRIKGTMWLSPFTHGSLEYGDDGLARIESIGKQAMALLLEVHTLAREAETTNDFLGNFYDFLVEKAGLDESISKLITLQEEQGLMDLAEETEQIWSKIVGIMDQISELIGEEKFVGKALLELMISGLSQIEIGVLPPSVDDLLMGTMQRTRAGAVKAVIVVGANEGLLPAAPSTEGLFTVDELDYLAAQGKEICKVEKIRTMEENLAIYRNLTKASDYLWMSYSVSDEEGKEIRPSEIIDTIKRIFPSLTVKKDVLNQENPMPLIGGKVNTLKHLTTALHQAKKGETISGAWKPVMDWFSEHDQIALERIEQGLSFSNTQKNLDEALMRQLYLREEKRELSLSPSRLERFSRCPFSHFVAYGLRPEERRLFAAGGREIGDIYHECLMKLSRQLTDEMQWESISEEECRALVQDVVRRETVAYKEGLFRFSSAEQYTAKRIEDACVHVCWALVEQVRAGRIVESKYEAGFGRNREIQPIEINAGNQKIYIEGKIDRLDVLANGRVKIIDYKTGNERFDQDEARAGYRLQLMLYLKAAQEKEKQPAGVFYFHIEDPRIDLSDTNAEKKYEEISKEMKKFFKLNGIMVDDGQVIREIAGEFEGISDVVPLRNGSEGVKGTSKGFLVSEEEFSQLQADVDERVQRLCEELVAGKMDIHPMKSKDQTPCTYCQYKGICRFDPSFSGCEYNIVKK